MENSKVQTGLELVGGNANPLRLRVSAQRAAQGGMGLVVVASQLHILIIDGGLQRPAAVIVECFVKQEDLGDIEA